MRHCFREVSPVVLGLGSKQFSRKLGHSGRRDFRIILKHHAGDRGRRIARASQGSSELCRQQELHDRENLKAYALLNFLDLQSLILMLGASCSGGATGVLWFRNVQSASELFCGLRGTVVVILKVALDFSLFLSPLLCPWCPSCRTPAHVPKIVSSRSENKETTHCKKIDLVQRVLNGGLECGGPNLPQTTCFHSTWGQKWGTPNLQIQAPTDPIHHVRPLNCNDNDLCFFVSSYDSPHPKIECQKTLSRIMEHHFLRICLAIVYRQVGGVRQRL